MPFYNNHVTVVDAIRSLLNQTCRVDKIIIVDDCSQENVDFRITGLDQRISVLRHAENRGLAASYNSGIGIVQCDLVVLMHPDVLLPTEFELEKLVAPFVNSKVLISAHSNAWLGDDYWCALTLREKSVIGAALHPRSHGFDGKFDCVRLEAFQSVGQFDADNYRTAGEDGEFLRRVSEVGLIMQSDARAEHRHSFGNDVTWGAVARKSMQYGEAQGVHLRRFPFRAKMQKTIVFYREILLLALLIESVLVGWPIFSCAIYVGVSLDTPIVIFRRDRSVLDLMCLVPIQIFKNLSHTMGVIIGFIRAKQVGKLNITSKFKVIKRHH